MTNLRSNMYAARSDRADAAYADLVAAERASALFRPEFVERRAVDFQRASAEMDRWSA